MSSDSYYLGYDDGYKEGYADAVKELKPHWIPCSERLPKEDHWLGGSGKQFSENVLVSVLNSADEDEWVDVSHTIDGEWTLELPSYCKIIAWKSLTEPYKPEEDES